MDYFLRIGGYPPLAILAADAESLARGPDVEPPRDLPSPGVRERWSGFPPAVAEAAILGGGLAAVTGRAEWLPAVLVPEPLGIAPMRDDMVHGVGRGQSVSALALGAERVAGQKQPPFREPPGRAIERTEQRITSAVGVTVTFALVAPPHRAMDGRAQRHGASRGVARLGMKGPGGAPGALLPIMPCL